MIGALAAKRMPVQHESDALTLGACPICIGNSLWHGILGTALQGDRGGLRSGRQRLDVPGVTPHDMS